MVFKRLTIISKRIPIIILWLLAVYGVVMVGNIGKFHLFSYHIDYGSIISSISIILITLKLLN
ncbi:MAG: hypothetical protein KKB88_02225 [Nanoarchaeota archaeon]|nr:hypothetical protein [Nanoarchaeota archaeon]